MKAYLKVLGLLTACACSLSASTNFSFTGAFSTDDQVQIFGLSLSSTTMVTFETLSYAGGTNAADTMILPGGFDPRLTWFQSDGTEIGSDNGGHCGSTGTFLGACNDAFFQGTLDAGSYFLVLTEDGNDPNGNLSDGFSQQGNGNFTANGSCTMFCDTFSGMQLTGNWAVDILTVDAANLVGTPEPGSVALTGIGLLLLAFAGRRTYALGRKECRKG